MSIVKKQHYVPQFYLRKFAKAGEQIYVYDKFQQKEFRASIKDVASSNYFHDLSQEAIEILEKGIREKQAEENLDSESVNALLERIKNVQIIEQYLGRLETRFAKVLDEVIDGLEKRGRFKPKFREELALMASVQFWRTHERREEIREMAQKLEEAVMPMVRRIDEAHGTNTTAADLGIDYSNDKIDDVHRMMIFDRKNLEVTARVLNSHIWVIGVNETDSPFFTSDNPISFHAHKTDDWHSNSGLASPGIEINFPLTPKYTLIMYERSYLNSMSRYNNRLMYLKPENVIYHNSLQVYSSYRQVYSISSKFGLVEEMLSKEPNLKNPRERWGRPSTG